MSGADDSMWKGVVRVNPTPDEEEVSNEICNPLWNRLISRRWLFGDDIKRADCLASSIEELISGESEEIVSAALQTVLERLLEVDRVLNDLLRK